MVGFHYCPSCGFRSPIDAKFCQRCGLSMPPPPGKPEVKADRGPPSRSRVDVSAEGLYCTDCGATVDESDFRFCTNCGAKFEN